MQYPPQTTRKNISGIVKELVILERQGKGRLNLRGNSEDLSEFFTDRLWVYDIKVTECPVDSWFSIVTLTADNKSKYFDIWKNCQLIFRLPTKAITY